MEFKISFFLSQHPTLDKPLHLLPGLTLSVCSVYSVFQISLRPCASIAFAAGSFGVLENRIFEMFSQTPRLPIAKATVKVTLVYIPVRSAGGESSFTNHIQYILCRRF